MKGLEPSLKIPDENIYYFGGKMVGKKKKKEKSLGLLLSRIGSSLVPSAVFTAVPRTAQSFSDTWPRKKKLSSLSTALGSVGNLAQAAVVAHTQGPREEFEDNANTSSERQEPETEEKYDDYESEGHYAEVDENILKNLSSSRREEEDKRKEKAGTQGEVIYATVNKRRKPQVTEAIEEDVKESSGSEDDITSVSGMGTDDDDDSSLVVNQFQPSTSKSDSRKRDSKKRKSNKVKSKRHSPRHSSKEVIIEEPVTKTDINHNLVTNADFADGPEDPVLTIPSNNDDDHLKTINNNAGSHSNKDIDFVDNKDHEIERNYNSPNEFEREQFNETNLDDYSDEGSPPLLVTTRREERPLGASTSDLVYCSHDVSPIGERKTPIGKGLSSEDVASFKEQWKNLEQLAMRQESILLEHQKLQVEQQQKLSEQQAIVEQHLSELPTSRLRSSLGQGEREEKEDHLFENETVSTKINKVGNHFKHQYNNTGSQWPETTGKRPASQREKDNFQNTLFSRSGEQQEPLASVQLELRKPEEKKDKTRKELVLNKTSFTDDGIISDEKTGRSKIKTSKKRKKKIRNDEGQPALQVNKDSSKETLQEMSTTLAKETCRKLRQQVKVLDREKSALESLSQSLNDENTTLKKLTQSLTKKHDAGTGVTFGLLQLQTEELKEENNFLKDSVHRLNVELGRYQAKFRPLVPSEVDTMFKTNDNQPAWLVNKKYVAPLLLAYDDRVKEKQDIIHAYEEEMQCLKKRVGEIMDENLNLHENLSKSEVSLHDREEWLQLEEQAKLVLEENAVLMERQQLQNTKIEELTTFYKGEVSRLSRLYAASESEKDVLESTLEVMKTSLNGFKKELETSSAEWKKHIPLDQHLDSVNECRRKLEELKIKTQKETESWNFKLEAAQEENKKLAQQLADYKLVNVQLKREVHSFHEIQRKNERKTLFLKEKLGHVQEREANAQETLSEVLKVAEKMSLERDALNEILTSKELEHNKVQSLVKREEDKLKECKSKACNKIAAIRGRVKEQEKITEELKDRYENEIKSLKILIRQQQRQLEDMVNEKRNVENELNVIYQKVDVDNHTMNHVT